MSSLRDRGLGAGVKFQGGDRRGERTARWRALLGVLGIPISASVAAAVPLPYAVHDQILATNQVTTTLANGKSNLLVNDGVADSSAHLVSINLQGSPNLSKGGVITLHADGTFSYDKKSQLANDQFCYTVTDSNNQTSSPATCVDIVLAAKNTLPDASTIPITMRPFGVARLLNSGNGNLLTSASDAQGNLFTIGLKTQAIHGQAVVNADGSFRYGNTGGLGSPSDSFQFELCELGGQCNTFTQNISIVNAHRPSVVNDAVQIPQGGSVSGIGIEANDSDADSGSLSYGIGQYAGGKLNAAVNFPTQAGVATVYANGSFDYSNTNSSATSDQFDYYACDPAFVCTRGTVTITLTNGVQKQNQLPVVADDAIQVASGGTATVLVGGASSVMANDADPDAGDVLTTKWVSDPDFGALTINANGTFSYQNTVAQQTSDSFEYQACDNHGACKRGKVYVWIGNGPADHLPVVIDDALQVAKGSGTAIAQIIGDLNSVDSVRDNDSDADATDKVAITVLSQPDGALSLIDSNGYFTYTPPNYATTPTTSFYYQACDLLNACALGKVTITVTDSAKPLDRAPWVTDDAIQVAPNGVATQLVGGATSLSQNDIDPDGDLALTVRVRSLPASGVLNFVNADGTFQYTAAGAKNDSFIYETCDSHGACTPGIVKIAVGIGLPNRLPFAVDDAIQAVPNGAPTQHLIGGASPVSSVLDNDKDPDGSALTLKAISPPLPAGSGDLVLNADGSFTYTPPANPVSDMVAYEACDALACVPAYIKINVTNAPPDRLPLARDDLIVVKPGSGISNLLANGHYSLLDNDTDSDNGPLSAKQLSGISTAAGQKIVVRSDGTFDYTAPSAATTDYFEYEACDNFGACGLAKVDIVVGAAAPVLSLTKTVSSGTLVANSGSYVLTVTNVGTAATSADITVSDLLPAGISLSGVHGAHWNCAAQIPLICSYPAQAFPLAPGASTTLTLDVAVAAGTLVASNTATAIGGGDTTCVAAASAANHCRASVDAAASTTPVAILGISGATQPGTFYAGTTGRYQLSVANTGGANSGSISVQNIFPADVSFVGAEEAEWTCVPSGEACTHAAIEAGSNTKLTLDVTINPAALSGPTAASLMTTVTQGDASCPSSTHCATTVVAGINAGPTPILSVSILGSPANFVKGIAANYAITVTNTGTAATSSNISLKDFLQAGLVLNSVDGANWTCSAGPVVNCSYPALLKPLAPGASTTLILKVDVTIDAVGTAGADNLATVAGGGDPTCPGADHCRGRFAGSVNATPIPILSLVKSASPGTFLDNTGSYPITVTNSGSVSTNAEMVLVDNLPTGMSLVGTDGFGWTCTGSTTVTCTYPANKPPLVSGGSSTVTLHVSVPNGVDPVGASNSAVVSGGGDVSCPSAIHCTADVVAGISNTSPVPSPVPILGVSETTYPGTFVANQPGSQYIVKVTNTGNATTTGPIHVTTVLPPGIWLNSVVELGWVCSPPGGSSFDCQSSISLGTNQSTTLTLIVNLNDDAIGLQGASDTVTVSGGGDATCPQATHCSGSVIAGVSAVPVPTLSITKQVTPDAFVAGQQGHYTLSVTNTGSVATTSGVSLHDVLPPGIAMTGWANVIGTWTCSGTTDVKCYTTSGGVGTGQTVAVSLTVSVDGTAIGPHGADNSVSAVDASGGDVYCAALPLASHCTASVAAAVNGLPPTATMAFLPATIPVGGISAMTIVLTNLNAVAINGVGFADTYSVQNGGGMKNAASGVVQSSNCGGTLVAPAGGTGIALSNGSIAANGNCSIVINVAGTAAGAWANQTGVIAWNGFPAGTTAAASLNVTATSQTPAPLAADDVMVVNAGQTATTVNGGAIHLLDNDLNPNGGGMKAFLSGAAPTQGVLTLKPDGSFIYVTNFLVAGTDSFQYVACDVSSGVCSTPATVNIQILLPGQPLPQIELPVTADDAAVLDAGTAVQHVNGNQESVLQNDLDPNQGGALVAKLIGASPASGTLQFNLPGKPNGSGTFNYQHGNAAAGASQDEFFYEACDTLFNTCAIGKVTITILPAGTPLPVIQLPIVVDDAMVVASGASTTALNGDVQGSVLTNDADLNTNINGSPGTLTASVVNGSGPSSGQLLSFLGTGTLNYQNVSGTSDGFLYRACDSIFSVCAIGNVAITVTPTGQVPPTILIPTALDDTASVAVGGSTSVVNGSQNSVLGNDGPDPNGGVLNAYVIGGGPAHGSLTGFDDQGHFTYQHDGSASATDSFTYQACDSTYHVCKSATVVITIGSAQGNAPGIACLLPRQVYSFGEAVNIDLSKLFTPPLGQTLSYSVTGAPPSVRVDGGSNWLAGTSPTSGTFPLVLTATAQPSQASASQNVEMQVLSAQDKRFFDGFDGGQKPCQ